MRRLSENELKLLFRASDHLQFHVNKLSKFPKVSQDVNDEQKWHRHYAVKYDIIVVWIWELVS